MICRRSIPLLLLAVAALVPGLTAQTTFTIPPTAPTQLTAPLAATPAVTHGRHAYVSYTDGKLNVRADNSSLNVILREVARQTGMRITGGVADQRVFGNYGPADAGTVLATLLDGTGVNIFVRENLDRTPAELILTPRTGSASLPGPSSPQFDEEAHAEALPLPQSAAPAIPPATPGTTNTTPVPQPSMSNGVTPVPDPHGSPVSSPPASPQPWNNVNGSSTNTSPTASTLPTTNSVPTDTLPTPSTTPSSTGIVDSPNPPPAGTTANPVGSQTTTTTVAPNGAVTTTTVTSPNSVKTPDQVYQQLLKIRQQQQPADSGTTSPALTNPASTTK